MENKFISIISSSILSYCQKELQGNFEDFVIYADTENPELKLFSEVYVCFKAIVTVEYADYRMRQDDGSNGYYTYTISFEQIYLQDLSNDEAIELGENEIKQIEKFINKNLN